MIGRREFIAGISAVAWPIPVPAQQLGKLPTIGYLSNLQANQFSATFFGRLRELGWIEGRNIAIEYRWSGGNSERSAEIATEFVHLKVDVIVAGGTINALAAKRATSEIPIVFPVAGDPVGLGLVASLAATLPA